MPELILQLADGSTRRHTLSAASQTIGRDAACDISVDDPGTSRRHARFSLTPQGYLVEDLGSKNGTLVNDAPCASRLLKDGDRILLGSVLAVFRDAAARTSPAVVVADDPDAGGPSTRYATRDKQLALSRQRLQHLYDLGERLTALQDQQALLENALSIAFETLRFERGAIALRKTGQRGLEWVVARNLHGAEGELTISGTLLHRALELGERAIFTAGEESGDPTVSIARHGICSAMCVPLMHQDRTLGVIYGDRRSTSTTYTGEDIDFLAGLARQISIGLINGELLEEQRRAAKLHHELDLARAIQTGLFPTALPAGERFQVAAINDPGQRVSGDYYDVIENEDGRYWALIADVTGEGVPAALLMAHLQATVRATIHETDDPGALLARWNRLICRNTSTSRFVTCLLALIDPRAGRLHVASAGHHPPLILRPPAACSTSTLDAGYPLGVDPDAAYGSVVLEPGPSPSIYFCYTDGVIEAMNDAGALFGYDGLRRVLDPLDELNPHRVVKQVRGSVATFAGGAPQSDDITLLAARIG